MSEKTYWRVTHLHLSDGTRASIREPFDTLEAALTYTPNYWESVHPEVGHPVYVNENHWDAEDIVGVDIIIEKYIDGEKVIAGIMGFLNGYMTCHQIYPRY